MQIRCDINTANIVLISLVLVLCKTRRRCLTTMPRGCPNIYLRPVSYVALFVTLCTAMVALCTSDWYSYREQPKKVKAYMGLWNVCHRKPDFGGNCTFMPEWRTDISKHMLTAVRVIYSMGILLLIGAILYPPFYKQMTSDVLKIEVMAVFTAGGGICLFVTMLLMTHEINSLNHLPTFGYSFIMGWTAMGMCLLTATLIYIASKGNVYIEKMY